MATFVALKSITTYMKRIFLAFALIGALAISLTGCQKDDNGKGNEQEQQGSNGYTAYIEIGYTDLTANCKDMCDIVYKLDGKELMTVNAASRSVTKQLEIPATGTLECTAALKSGYQFGEETDFSYYPSGKIYIQKEGTSGYSAIYILDMGNPGQSKGIKKDQAETIIKGKLATLSIKLNYSISKDRVITVTKQ